MNFTVIYTGNTFIHQVFLCYTQPFCEGKKETKPSFFPPFRYLPNPFNAGKFHLRLRVKPFGNGLRDQRTAFFLEQFYHLRLLGDNTVNLRCLMIKEISNDTLFRDGGE